MYPDGHERYIPVVYAQVGMVHPGYMPRWVWYTLVIYHPGYVGSIHHPGYIPTLLHPGYTTTLIHCWSLYYTPGVLRRCNGERLLGSNPGIIREKRLSGAF